MQMYVGYDKPTCQRRDTRTIKSVLIFKTYYLAYSSSNTYFNNETLLQFKHLKYYHLKRDLLSILGNYGSIKKADHQKILSRTVHKTYRKGDLLLKPPEISNRIWFTYAGILRYFTINEAGDAKTEMFVEAGDFFTDLTSFNEQIPTEVFIEAEVPTEVIVFERHHHEALKKEVNGWEKAMNCVAHKRLESQLKLSRLILQLDAKSSYRLMVERYPNIVKNVPAAHLASFLGITPHSLSRIKRHNF